MFALWKKEENMEVLIRKLGRGVDFVLSPITKLEPAAFFLLLILFLALAAAYAVFL
jgi:hypothetical protein